MLNKRQLTILFVALCAFSFISVIITFIVWNKPEKIHMNANEISFENIKGNVEVCRVGRSSLYVKGWIFATNEYRGVYKGNTYVAANDNGTFYKIKTIREIRPDVTTFFKEKKKKYDLSGYSSSSRFGFFGLRPSKEILIITEHNGVVRGMKHVCN